MSQFLQIMTAMREQMRATMSRTDAMRPATFLLLATVLLLLASTQLAALQWAVGYMVAVFSASLVFYGACYVFFMLTGPDALRSERFVLDKLAIEHRVGDNFTGLVDQGEDGGRTIEQDIKPQLDQPKSAP